MKYIGWFFAVFILSFGLFLLAPKQSLAPGEMLQGHNEFSGDCLKCHTPFSTHFSPKCTACHEPAKIGFLNTRGEALPRTEKIKFDHANASDCNLCHSEHRGPEMQANMVAFAHTKLGSNSTCQNCHESPQDRFHIDAGKCSSCHQNTKNWKQASFDHANATQCQSCHQHQSPQDRLHKEKAECSSCHQNTNNWKQASFDHSQAGQCASCHKAPQDSLHAGQTGECASCHNTNQWRGVSFDHDRFFRLGKKRHNPPCATCHPGNNYQSYTCYGCHAHSERGVAREHREEGIYEYGTCTQCHRSGSESEAKRNWRKIRQERTGSSDRYRSHEHDDDDD